MTIFYFMWTTGRHLIPLNQSKKTEPNNMKNLKVVLSELFLCTDTYLTKSLGLSHQYKHIWGQYGHAEVHQNDGPLWTNVPENQRKHENHTLTTLTATVLQLWQLLSLQKLDVIKVRDPFINIHLSYFSLHWTLTTWAASQMTCRWTPKHKHRWAKCPHPLFEL